MDEHPEFLDTYTYKKQLEDLALHKQEYQAFLARGGVSEKLPIADATDTDRIADAKQALHMIIIDPHSTNAEKINASRAMLSLGIEEEFDGREDIEHLQSESERLGVAWDAIADSIKEENSDG